MICSKCKRNLPDDSEFCQYCGNKIEKMVVTSVEEAVEEPKKVKTPAAVTATPVTPVSSVVEDEPEPKKKKPVKTKYCSRCGSVIDNKTKACTGCGKQYFRGLRLTEFSVTVIVLSIILSISAVLNVVQLVDRNDLNDSRKHWRNKVEVLENDISDLQSDLREHQDLIDFVDEYVVFVEDDGTDLYHKFECYKFKGDKFWVFNIEAAKNRDYTACSYCH